MTHHTLTKLGKTPRVLAKVLRHERGTASIEYGLMAAMIAIAGVQAMSSLGISLADTFGFADSAMVAETAIMRPGGGSPPPPDSL